MPISEAKIQLQLSDAVTQIADSDFPQKWQGLVPVRMIACFPRSMSSPPRRAESHTLLNDKIGTGEQTQPERLCHQQRTLADGTFDLSKVEYYPVLLRRLI